MARFQRRWTNRFWRHAFSRTNYYTKCSRSDGQLHDHGICWDWYKNEKDKGLTIDKIARRLGDNHDTVVRLVNGMFVLDQAADAKIYDIQDQYPGKRFGFSHLYTALTRPGYRE